MRDSSDLFFIHCLTGCHPGSGTALGVVDLPVQRERHTRWPTVPGSSLKGVLRAACSDRVGDGGADDLLAAFGPETGRAGDHAGALSVTDARVLAFPVRSLNGVFAWVTCPAVLDRFRRDLAVVGYRDFPAGPSVRESQAICAENSPLLICGRKLVLEEFAFTRTTDSAASDVWADPIARWLFARGDVTAERFRARLVVLPDDDFGHFVQYATEVAARIGLDSETKTVKDGALFYEEFLPPETILYSLVLATESRKPDWRQSADRVLSWVRGAVPPVLQIGGDATVGKGLCSVRFAGAPREET